MIVKHGKNERCQLVRARGQAVLHGTWGSRQHLDFPIDFLAQFLLGDFQVVTHLQPQPYRRAYAEIAGKTHRRIQSDGSPGVDDLADSDWATPISHARLSPASKTREQVDLQDRSLRLHSRLQIRKGYNAPLARSWIVWSPKPAVRGQ